MAIYIISVLFIILDGKIPVLYPKLEDSTTCVSAQCNQGILCLHKILWFWDQLFKTNDVVS